MEVARASTPLKNSAFSQTKKSASFNNLVSQNLKIVKPVGLSSFGSASRATEMSSSEKQYSPYISKEKDTTSPKKKS
jgi:hypothetical protein